MRREDDHRTQVDVQEAVTARDPDGRLANGTEIEGYVIDGVLGKGGMGIVYSATHKVIGKRAAIKVLRTEVSQNPMHLQRFIQEAQAVNAIGHPNIIDIFDFGQLPDGRAFHLMDLMVGESLRQRLRRGALHPSEAASVLEAVSSALMAAHDKGFVHRDLKPDNIYLITVESGWPDVKLLDFGLAKLMPEAGTAAAFVTKTGVMLGTPEYMSPEQARGEPVDYRTDVYALGIVMYEILAGERPFPSSGDAFTTLQYHAEEPPPSIGAAVPQLPTEMVQLVDAMLSKDPFARPSLAAVRTVIKRLRTTKLPTHSIAGQELASYSNPDMAAIGPSKLGASPLVPSQAEPSYGSQAYAQYDAHSMPPAVGRAMTPSNMVPPSRAATPTDEEQDLMRTIPRSGSGALTDEERAQLRSLQKLAPTGASSSGLAAPGAQPHAGTTLGVPPPPKPGVAPPILMQAAHQPTRTSNVWLILGALLFIGAGIALAFVLVGR